MEERRKEVVGVLRDGCLRHIVRPTHAGFVVILEIIERTEGKSFEEHRVILTEPEFDKLIDVVETDKSEKTTIRTGKNSTVTCAVTDERVTVHSLHRIATSQQVAHAQWVENVVTFTTEEWDAMVSDIETALGRADDDAEPTSEEDLIAGVPVDD